jgi:hypothetical protein
MFNVTGVWLDGKKFGLRAYVDSCIQQVYGQNIVGDYCKIFVQDGVITQYVETIKG